MKDYNTNSHKTDGFQLEPVRVELDGKRSIEAVHHVINPREKTIGLHINEREGGIDLKIPICNVTAIAKSAAGARAIDGMESTDDTHDRDGEEGAGNDRDAVEVAREHDYVEYDGEVYMVERAVSRDMLELSMVFEGPIEAPVGECTPCEADGSPVTTHDRVSESDELAADGGI